MVAYEVISAANAGQLVQVGKPLQVTGYVTDFSSTYGPRWLRVLFRPEGVRVAEVLKSYDIEIKDFESASQIALFHWEGQEGVDLLTASADGRWLAAASGQDKTLRLWDMDSLEQANELPLRDYERMMAGSFSSDNRYLALAGCTLFGANEVCLRSKVVIYDLSSGEVVEEIDGYQIQTRALAFLPDTYMLAIAGWGEPIRQTGLLVWDLRQHQSQTEFSGEGNDKYGTVSVSDDGSVLAAGRDGATFWATQSWEKLNWVEAGSSRGLTFFPGTQIIVLADDGQNLLVIDGSPPEPSYVVGNAHSGLETDMQYIANIFPSPDGCFLYIHDSQRGLVEKWGIPVMVTATPAP